MNKIVNLSCVPLDGNNIINLLEDDTKIKPYSELNNYSNIDELLPKDYDYVVIFIDFNKLNNDNPSMFCCMQDKKIYSMGHWIAFLKFNNVYELFDSISDNTSNHMRQPIFQKLFKDRKCQLNMVPFQESNEHISTCGHHVVHRVYQFISKRMTLHEYVIFMSNLRIERVGSYDYIVSEFVLDRYNNLKEDKKNKCLNIILC